MCTFYGGSGDDAYVVASEIKVIGGEAVACCDNTTGVCTSQSLLLAFFMCPA